MKGRRIQEGEIRPVFPSFLREKNPHGKKEEKKEFSAPP
jgi:hypothetical protein